MCYELIRCYTLEVYIGNNWVLVTALNIPILSYVVSRDMLVRICISSYDVFDIDYLMASSRTITGLCIYRSLYIFKLFSKVVNMIIGHGSVVNIYFSFIFIFFNTILYLVLMIEKYCKSRDFTITKLVNVNSFFCRRNSKLIN